MDNQTLYIRLLRVMLPLICTKEDASKVLDSLDQSVLGGGFRSASSLTERFVEYIVVEFNRHEVTPNWKLLMAGLTEMRLLDKRSNNVYIHTPIELTEPIVRFIKVLREFTGCPLNEAVNSAKALMEIKFSMKVMVAEGISQSKADELVKKLTDLGARCEIS